MLVKSVYLLPFLSLILSTPENEFTIVSTTKKPAEIQPFESQLSGLQNRLEVVEFDKINILQRLNNLETKSEQIIQMLKTMNTQTADSQNAALPKNCKEVQQRGHNISKIYQIKPDSSLKPIEVLCDMERRGGGWTYILNRFDGNRSFNLKWNDYEVGFGNLSGDFWLGLHNIYLLTENKIDELLVELVDWDDKEVYALYDAFSLGNECEGYSLKILGGYDGTAGDSLSSQAKMKFTTIDKDQDADSGNCAEFFGGGWWYNTCSASLLTGKYYRENPKKAPFAKGIYWLQFRGYEYSLKQARMMIRSQS